MNTKNVFDAICKEIDCGSNCWTILHNAKKGIKKALKMEQCDSLSLLRQNEEYQDINKGKRCFILGNGPSLKNVDFSSLKDEYVFTVNMLMDYPDFIKLKTNYHVIADGSIFGEGEDNGLEDNFYLKKIEKLEKCRDVVLFAPLVAEKHIEKTGLDKKIAVRYFDSYNYFKRIQSFDLCSPLPGFNKVVHYAIAIAIYMGFNEIYLLGCDETGILSYIRLLMDGDTNNDHCYRESKQAKNSWMVALSNHGIEYEFSEEAISFGNYRVLSEWCESHNIKLLNLTEKTLIDSINKGNLEDILNNNGDSYFG